jgi:hypothetical protein
MSSVTPAISAGEDAIYTDLVLDGVVEALRRPRYRRRMIAKGAHGPIRPRGGSGNLLAHPYET